MTIRRVAILGSSISMTVRPKRSGAPYPRVLEQMLTVTTGDTWIVDNFSRVAATIEDSHIYVNRLVADQPEAVVLHYGHVEAVRRPHTRAAWYRLHEVRPGASPLLEYRNRAANRYASLRRVLGVRRQWTPLSRFERALTQLLEYLADETRASFVLVAANPGDSRIEAWGPGSLAEIQRYNERMQEIGARFGATWVAIPDFVGDPVEDYIFDGTHFSPKGHAALAAILCHTITDPGQQ